LRALVALVVFPPGGCPEGGDRRRKYGLRQLDISNNTSQNNTSRYNTGIIH
jgi:hypothetical protein